MRLTANDVRFRRGVGTDALAAWECFKALSEVPANDPVVLFDQVCTVDPARDGDRLLYETSVEQRFPDSGWSGGEPDAEPETFHLSFTRQLSFEDPPASTWA